MTHPDIEKMNKWGTLEPEKVIAIGTCENCGEDLLSDCEMWEDNDDNKFCCQDCAIEFHGILEAR